jgi:hypothetical protein
MTTITPGKYSVEVPVNLGVMGSEPGVSEDDGGQRGVHDHKRDDFSVIAGCDQCDRFSDSGDGRQSLTTEGVNRNSVSEGFGGDLEFVNK